MTRPMKPRDFRARTIDLSVCEEILVQSNVRGFIVTNEKVERLKLWLNAIVAGLNEADAEPREREQHVRALDDLEQAVRQLHQALSDFIGKHAPDEQARHDLSSAYLVSSEALRKLERAQNLPEETITSTQPMEQGIEIYRTKVHVVGCFLEKKLNSVRELAGLVGDMKEALVSDYTSLPWPIHGNVELITSEILKLTEDPHSEGPTSELELTSLMATGRYRLQTEDDIIAWLVGGILPAAYKDLFDSRPGLKNTRGPYARFASRVLAALNLNRGKEALRKAAERFQAKKSL